MTYSYIPELPPAPREALSTKPRNRRKTMSNFHNRQVDPGFFSLPSNYQVRPDSTLSSYQIPVPFRIQYPPKLSPNSKKNPNPQSFIFDGNEYKPVNLFEKLVKSANKLPVNHSGAAQAMSVINEAMSGESSRQVSNNMQVYDITSKLHGLGMSSVPNVGCTGSKTVSTSAVTLGADANAKSTVDDSYYNLTRLSDDELGNTEDWQVFQYPVRPPDPIPTIETAPKVLEESSSSSMVINLRLASSSSYASSNSIQSSIKYHSNDNSHRNSSIGLWETLATGPKELETKIRHLEFQDKSTGFTDFENDNKGVVSRSSVALSTSYKFPPIDAPRDNTPAEELQKVGNRVSYLTLDGKIEIPEIEQPADIPYFSTQMNSSTTLRGSDPESSSDESDKAYSLNTAAGISARLERRFGYEKEKQVEPIVKPISTARSRHSRSKSMFNIDLEGLVPQVSTSSASGLSRRSHIRSKSLVSVLQNQLDLEIEHIFAPPAIDDEIVYDTPLEESRLSRHLKTASVPAMMPDRSFTPTKPLASFHRLVTTNEPQRSQTQNIVYQRGAFEEVYTASKDPHVVVASQACSSVSSYSSSGSSKVSNSTYASSVADSIVLMDLTDDTVDVTVIGNKRSNTITSYKSSYEKTKGGRVVEVVLVDDDETWGSASNPQPQRVSSMLSSFSDLESIYNKYVDSNLAMPNYTQRYPKNSPPTTQIQKFSKGKSSNFAPYTSGRICENSFSLNRTSLVKNALGGSKERAQVHAILQTMEGKAEETSQNAEDSSDGTCLEVGCATPVRLRTCIPQVVSSSVVSPTRVKVRLGKEASQAKERPKVYQTAACDSGSPVRNRLQVKRQPSQKKTEDILREKLSSDSYYNYRGEKYDFTSFMAS
ncbi:hypothetical protein BABINDRAFT_162930 [Babjeviella inositovora NRRL Y-12698]|uniref:Uncharacterized protein n=1 Tax=Babjeviella inositovora NRRL Y-12698 TaxID=984486 RepID=A0A1E3QLD0_9ASCO|nr:uncharacterized protein BABINDRAFT_162930 [Babjeviella inositovora NRRL Y-12698]ODQ78274.1 hypothetical protein BABINDRAFT_162930 [Babjeviella inositovora NRRL Y-12698]